jgi:hypothetical protein
VDLKPKLYYKVDENGVPFDNFCSDAAIGANEAGVSCIAFSDIKDVPKNPYNIVVTTVEESQAWLGYKVFPINDSWAKEFKNREENFCLLEELTNFPCFIKPAQDIKAFTGLIVNNIKETRLYTNNYDGQLSVQEIVEFESEYRVYVHRDRGVLGVKHYLGDPYIIPQKSFVDKIVNSAGKNLKENSYSLDIGIDKNNKNYLIEINDGWAIGNYGLSPKDYYSFIKTRWLQLTNILK